MTRPKITIKRKKQKETLRDRLEEKKKSLEERAHAKINIDHELNIFEEMVEKLKVEYERFFLSIIDRPPEMLHKTVKKQLRIIHKAPFKKTRSKHKLRMLESRYNTLNTYWVRVLKQKEEGVYCKDVYKAELKDRRACEEREALTERGQASAQIQELFDTYKKMLEQQSGQKANINFAEFQKSMLHKAQLAKDKYGGAGVSFQISVKNGKVAIKAKKKKAGVESTMKRKKRVTINKKAKPKTEKRKVSI